MKLLIIKLKQYGANCRTPSSQMFYKTAIKRAARRKDEKQQQTQPTYDWEVSALTTVPSLLPLI